MSLDAVLLTYYLRCPGMPSVRILCYEATTLASEIHRYLQLPPNRHVRIDVDPDTLRPTGPGRVTTLDQRVVFEFTAALAGAATIRRAAA